MKRTRIDYGIDLGTTNSAVARMEAGEPVIRKTDTLKDTLPSCVGYNKKKNVIVGDAASNAMRSDILNALRNADIGQTFAHNFFVEFKRTMGTDKSYFCSTLNKELSSEELSSEVLKRLNSFFVDEEVNATIITIPAKFTSNQKDATLRAARLAGIEHCELLQEPIAAAMAFGIGSETANGRWLVFDFGGGTFDAVIIRCEEGILKVVDTEGDNHLGGKNIDLAIVDEILSPHVEENFCIDGFLNDSVLNEYFRSALKTFAEPARIQLSFSDSADILSDPGDFPDDDNGEEIELDLKLTRELLAPIEEPIFQRAIDICNKLLKRNKLTGMDIDSLVLIGGPTHSPNLRRMLREQITERIDTKIDPMTAVAKGAALYASTISVPDSILSKAVDITKVQIDLKHEATSVEEVELVTIKIAEGAVASNMQVEIERGDKAWASGRKTVGDLGEVIEVQLEKGRANFFSVGLYDAVGKRVECEPNQFTILQGTKPGGATLPYHFGVEIKDADSGKLVFTPLAGLEKNRSYPATGTKNDLRTQQPAGPGVGEILIPLYEGDADAKGTRAIFSELVYNTCIKGDDLPAFVPAGSPIEITVKVIRDGEIVMKVYFPSLEDTVSVEVPTHSVQSASSSDWLYGEIENLRSSIEFVEELGSNVDSAEIGELSAKLDDVEALLDQSPEDYDRRMQVRNSLRELFREVDKIENATEWPALEAELDEEFDKLNEYFGKRSGVLPPPIADRFRVAIQHFGEQMPAIKKARDKKSARRLIGEIGMTGFAIDDVVHGPALYLQMMGEYDRDFDDYHWSDRNRARLLINQGLGMSAGDPTKAELLGVLREILALLPDSEHKTSHLTGNLT